MVGKTGRKTRFLAGANGVFACDLARHIIDLTVRMAHGIPCTFVYFNMVPVQILWFLLAAGS